MNFWSLFPLSVFAGGAIMLILGVSEPEPKPRDLDAFKEDYSSIFYFYRFGGCEIWLIFCMLI